MTNINNGAKKSNRKRARSCLVVDVIINYEMLFYREFNSLQNSVGHIYYQELTFFFTATQLS